MRHVTVTPAPFSSARNAKEAAADELDEIHRGRNVRADDVSHILKILIEKRATEMLAD
jgi:hypothetical protein